MNFTRPKAPPRFGRMGKTIVGAGLAGAPVTHVRGPVATPMPNAVGVATGEQQQVTPPTSPDPRDSGYFAQLAGAQRQHDLSAAGLNASDANAGVDLNARIAQLAQARVGAEQKQNQSANKAGLFYSSTNSRGLNDIRANEINQESAAQDAYRRALAASAQQRAGLDISLEDTGTSALQDAIGRQLQRDQLEPAPGLPAAQNAPPAGHVSPAGSPIHPVTGRPVPRKDAPLPVRPSVHNAAPPARRPMTAYGRPMHR